MIDTLPTNGPFDLAATLNSGQVFHWNEHSHNSHSGFLGTIGDAPTFLAQIGDNQIFTIQQGPFDESTGLDRNAENRHHDPIGSVHRTNPVASYLALDQADADIRATFPQNDPFFDSALNYCPGLRILHQPMWECLATFITSSLKQVAHIRDISLTLRCNHGTRHEFLGEELFSYPAPAALAEAGEAKLRACALGYRAKSLHLTATAIADGSINLAELDSIEDHAEAVKFLCQFHGVGEKIANCALLFGANRLGAFPIDVWIERVLRQGYRKRVKGAKLQRWAEGYFGPYAGYAQQFLFHYGRVGGLGKNS
ncbi:MAG: DNA-3-methyladenine glycosylase 2 [Verrucomicrobiales bacterium]